MRVVNIYDNQVGKGCIWDGGIHCTRKALEDVNWEPIIQRKVLVAGNVNAYSPVWNPHCHERQNTSILEGFMD